jgi:hypothetical protein
MIETKFTPHQIEEFKKFALDFVTESDAELFCVDFIEYITHGEPELYQWVRDFNGNQHYSFDPYAPIFCIKEFVDGKWEGGSGYDLSGVIYRERQYPLDLCADQSIRRGKDIKVILSLIFTDFPYERTALKDDGSTLRIRYSIVTL